MSIESTRISNPQRKVSKTAKHGHHLEFSRVGFGRAPGHFGLIGPLNPAGLPVPGDRPGLVDLERLRINEKGESLSRCGFYF